MSGAQGFRWADGQVATRGPRLPSQASPEGEPATAWSPVVAACAGIALGTLAVPLPVLPMTLGALLLSTIYKQFVGLVAFYCAIVAWWTFLPSLFAPVVHGEGIAWYEIGDMFRAMLFGAGLLASAGFYAAGRSFRIRREPTVVRWPTLVAAAASLALLLGTIGLAAPAGASFGFTLPQGWSGAMTGNSYYGRSAGPCTDYEAVDGSPSSLSTDAAVPVLCVEVAAFNASSNQGSAQAGDKATSPPKAEQCYELEDLGGGPTFGQYTWTLLRTPAQPPIPGAYEKVLLGPEGETLYGLGLERTRLVGPALEDMCYLISLTVPKDSQISEADANNLLSTFRFR